MVGSTTVRFVSEVDGHSGVLRWALPLIGTVKRIVTDTGTFAVWELMQKKREALIKVIRTAVCNAPCLPMLPWLRPASLQLLLTRDGMEGAARLPGLPNSARKYLTFIQSFRREAHHI